MKVHRLIQLGHENGLVRILVNRVPDGCAVLETQLIQRFGLTSCTVAPDLNPAPDMFESMQAVATAGASYFFGRLESTDARVIGIGSGRTMARTAEALPPLPRPNISFVSLTGDFAVLNDANPFEMMNLLIRKTGGKGHAFTAPLIVDSVKDRALFMRQRAVAHVMNIAHEADFFFTGLGHVGPHSFLDSYNLVTEADIKWLRDRDVVGDIAGNLMDSAGRFVEDGLAERMLVVPSNDLRTRHLVIVVGGVEKWMALRGALRSGCVNGLITHAALAQKVLEDR